jgi:hypothetical protein
VFSLITEKSDLAGTGHILKRNPAAKGSQNVAKCGFADVLIE